MTSSPGEENIRDRLEECLGVYPRFWSFLRTVVIKLAEAACCILSPLLVFGSAYLLKQYGLVSGELNTITVIVLLIIMGFLGLCCMALLDEVSESFQNLFIRKAINAFDAAFPTDRDTDRQAALGILSSREKYTLERNIYDLFTTGKCSYFSCDTMTKGISKKWDQKGFSIPSIRKKKQHFVLRKDLMKGNAIKLETGSRLGKGNPRKPRPEKLVQLDPDVNHQGMKNSRKRN